MSRAATSRAATSRAATRPIRRAVTLTAATAMVLALVPLGGAAAQQTPTASVDIACPDPPEADFTDIAGSEHEDAIRCLADLEFTEGLVGGEQYGPRQDVSRGQMASFLASILAFGTGEELEPGPDAFDDDEEATEHEDAIDALAAIGVVDGFANGTYRPNAAVTRAQMASFLTRTLDHLDDGEQNRSHPPASDVDGFDDDDGTFHEAAIDALAATRIVEGYADGTYRPAADVTRGQMAAFLVRSVATAIEDSLIDGEVIGDDEFTATVRRTAYGVPHIEAENVGSLSYGMGYATAADTLCELMDRVITANGERSRYLGPGEGNANVVSDAYHRRLIEDGTYDGLELEPGVSPESPSTEARAAVRGYAAGVARYLADTPPADLDSRCGEEAWVEPFTAEEYWRVLVTYLSDNLQQGAQFFAAPPGEEPAVQTSPRLEPTPDPEAEGSNAYAFGSETTKDGGGVLLGNPHYPWDGPLRFYRAHLTIPGELNVVGAALINTPFVGIGHTDRVAWSHTVSTARRAGFFELTLAEGDPTSYVFDGEVVAMDETDVTVDVRTPDGVAQIDHTFYSTPFGDLIESPDPADGLAWTDTRAVVFENTIESTRLVDQYLAMYAADDVDGLFDALGEYQATAYNTTATDADGGTFFGDVGAIPHVTDAKWDRCATSPVAQGFLAQRQPMLDGSRSDCQWGSDDDAAVPGVFGQSATPHLFRDDYVTQSNDSYWLTNPEQPLVGLPRIFGEERTQRSLRTRLGLVQVEDRLDGSDGLDGTGFDLETVQEVLFANRVHAAELVRDDLVAACEEAGSVTVDGGEQDLTEACQVLSDWDTRVDTDSRGAHLFVRFVANGGLRFAVPFDPQNPVDTPSTLDTDDEQVLVALGNAVRDVEAASIELDAPWGSVQTEQRGEERIPIHGGPGSVGAFNVISPATPFQDELGWTSIRAGASWVMSVEFTPDGPISEGVLTYSQSPDPASPFFADQTRLYSAEGWDPMLFDPADVREEAVTTETIASDD